jgi:hypothetical protein
VITDPDRLAALRWLAGFYATFARASDVGLLARAVACLLDLQAATDAALARIDPAAPDLPPTVAAALLGLSTANVRAMESLLAIAHEARPAYEAMTRPARERAA